MGTNSLWHGFAESITKDGNVIIEMTALVTTMKAASPPGSQILVNLDEPIRLTPLVARCDQPYFSPHEAAAHGDKACFIMVIASYAENGYCFCIQWLGHLFFRAACSMCWIRTWASFIQEASVILSYALPGYVTANPGCGGCCHREPRLAFDHVDLQLKNATSRCTEGCTC